MPFSAAVQGDRGGGEGADPAALVAHEAQGWADADSATAHEPTPPPVRGIRLTAVAYHGEPSATIFAVPAAPLPTPTRQVRISARETELNLLKDVRLTSLEEAVRTREVAEAKAALAEQNMKLQAEIGQLNLRCQRLGEQKQRLASLCTELKQRSQSHSAEAMQLLRKRLSHTEAQLIQAADVLTTERRRRKAAEDLARKLRRQLQTELSRGIRQTLKQRSEHILQVVSLEGQVTQQRDARTEGK